MVALALTAPNTPSPGGKVARQRRVGRGTAKSEVRNMPDTSIMLELCDILGISVNELCGYRLKSAKHKI